MRRSALGRAAKRMWAGIFGSTLEMHIRATPERVELGNLRAVEHVCALNTRWYAMHLDESRQNSRGCPVESECELRSPKAASADFQAGNDASGFRPAAWLPMSWSDTSGSLQAANVVNDVGKKGFRQSRACGVFYLLPDAPLSVPLGRHRAGPTTSSQ